METGSVERVEGTGKQRSRVRLRVRVGLSQGRIACPRWATMTIDRASGLVEVRELYGRAVASSTLSAIADSILYRDALARASELRQERRRGRELRRFGG